MKLVNDETSLYKKKLNQLQTSFILILKGKKKHIIKVRLYVFFIFMKKWAIPLRKTFEQDFFDIRWKKLLTIKYEQATILEYYEYINKTTDEQLQEIQKIIEPLFKMSFLDKIKLVFNKNYQTKLIKWADIEWLILSVMQNRYRWYESIFTDIKKRIWTKKGWKWVIDSVWIMMICKNYNMSPTDLLNNYTLEQYLWLLDGIERYNNAQTKKWQAINNLAVIDKDAVKKRLEKNKQQFEKFKK